MATKAILEQHNTAADTESEHAASETVIPETMTALYESSRSSNRSLTPKEINQQLSAILESYDVLSHNFGLYQEQIDQHLAQISEKNNQLAASMVAMGENFDLEKQSVESALILQVDDSKALRSEVADQFKTATTELQSLASKQLIDTETLQSELKQLDELQLKQSQIIQLQTERLDQFDHAVVLLNESTRGNKQRIQALADETQKRQRLVDTHIQGLSALTRENREKHDKLQQFVTAQARQTEGLEQKLNDEVTRLEKLIAAAQQQLEQRISEETTTLHEVLALETNTLQLNIDVVDGQLSEQIVNNKKRFKQVGIGFACTAILIAAVVVSVKWMPAMAPLNHRTALSTLEQQQSALEDSILNKTAVQDETIVTLINEVQTIAAADNSLQRRQQLLDNQLTTVQEALDDLSYVVNGPGIIDSKLLSPQMPLLDKAWLSEQALDLYVVQLVTVYSFDDMVIFTNENQAVLNNTTVSYTETDVVNRSRYNVFMGSYETYKDAVAAIQQLPLAMRINKPWIRSIGSVVEVAN